MKSIFPTPNSDPVQNYSLNFEKQKEENLAGDSRIPASRKLVRPMFQVILETRRLVCPPSAFLPAKRPVSRKEPFLPPRGSGKLFLPILRMEEPCQKRSPRWLQEWCVITTRQSEAALHWDTIRPVLLKAFANHGTRYFSENIGFDLFMKEAARKKHRVL